MEEIFDSKFHTDLFDELHSDFEEPPLKDCIAREVEMLLNQNGDLALFDNIFDNNSDGSDSGIDCLPISPTSSDSNSEHLYSFDYGFENQNNATEAQSPDGDMATIYVMEDSSGSQHIVFGDDTVKCDVKMEDIDGELLLIDPNSMAVPAKCVPCMPSPDSSTITSHQLQYFQNGIDLKPVKQPNLFQLPVSVGAQFQVSKPATKRAANTSVIKPTASPFINGKSSVLVQPNGNASNVLLVPSSPALVVSKSNPVILTATTVTPTVDYFVNSKKKIQPKPSQTPCVNSYSTQIKQNDFTDYCQPANSPPITEISPVMSPVASDCGLDSSSPLYAVELSDSNDLKLLKRHHRMIKNRESASLSRKRRKDYLKNLEDTLRQFMTDNQNLAKENKQLKRKIEDLQGENEKLRKGSIVGGKKPAVGILFAVMMLVALNFKTTSIFSNNADTVSSSVHLPLSGSDITHRYGRTLLSVDDSPELQLSDIQQTLEALRQSLDNLNDTTSKPLRDSVMCPTYYNQTDSIRLVNELRNWVLGHKEEWKRRSASQLEQPISKMEQQANRRRKIKGNSHKVMHSENKMASRELYESGKNELQLFMAMDGKYRRFLNAIHRRNDTFYVVSFRKDHLLLPATHMNKTAVRPRMSFVMPAIGLNETMQPPAGSIAMIQVDCDVTATRLLHLHSSAMPTAENATYGPRQRPSHESWLDID